MGRTSTALQLGRHSLMVLVEKHFELSKLRETTNVRLVVQSMPVFPGPKGVGRGEGENSSGCITKSLFTQEFCSSRSWLRILSGIPAHLP